MSSISRSGSARTAARSWASSSIIKVRPIAGAELINPGNSSANFRKAETGPDGRFRLENLYETNVPVRK